MHDLDLAGRCADRLALLEGGAIVAEAPPEAMLGSATLRETFGIERVGGEWRPLASLRPENEASPSGDRRSSP
jgi:iron complex transport system ATP-binding protein